MSFRPDVIVARARALSGSRFRPQGRDPRSGLDCVGLVLSTFAIPPDEVRRDYRLRGRHRAEVEKALGQRFRKVGRKQRRAGDVLLCAIAPDQLHLAISCGASFVHADARLRRIVETPGDPPWPVIGAFRRRAGKPKSS